VKLFLALALVAATACVHPATFSETNVNGCIQKQCAGSGDAQDRASCESSCRQTYGR